jgi:hypothetical protein
LRDTQEALGIARPASTRLGRDVFGLMHRLILWT